jgi:hypothetical protein
MDQDAYHTARWQYHMVDLKTDQVRRGSERN